MKRVLICLLSLISVYNEGKIKVTSAAYSDNRRFTVSHYEESLQSKKEESMVPDSEMIEATKKIPIHKEKNEPLISSQSALDNPNYYYKNNEIPSDLPKADETFVLASEVATPGKLTDLMESENENGNESSQFTNTYQNVEYVTAATDSDLKAKLDSSGGNTSEKLNNETIVGRESPRDGEREAEKNSPEHGDIPSFSEWTQKQLAEAEKKKMDQNETTETLVRGRGKFRIKNYASPDCGAKIVAANPESVSSSSVLSSLKDEYMLNYCTNRIWFIVELCEAIQAKQLDLANFELFSSSPRHFSVFVSHRFPTREWSNVGKFTAEDSRDIQTFNLNPHLFGKYIKVEMHSHYGREQFCPISWVGVYGTSEYEVLAKEDEKNLLSEDDYGDSYDEEIFLGHKRNSPKNLFSSATEAVLSIVKKATAPFMKSENNETESKNCSTATSSINSKCVSPRYIIVCNNCSQTFYDQVFQYLSCEFDKLEPLTVSPFVRHVLVHGETCIELGLDFSDERTGAPFPSNFLRTSEQSVKYLRVMLKNSFLAALCNALAVAENKVVVNATAEGIEGLKNLTHKVEYCERNASADFPHPEPSPALTASPCVEGCLHASPPEFSPSTTLGSERMPEGGHANLLEIRPTKTASENDGTDSLPSFGYPDVKTDFPELKSIEPVSNEYQSSMAASTEDGIKGKNGDLSLSSKKEGKSAMLENKGGNHKDVDPTITEKNNANGTAQDSATLESIISDLNAIERVANSPSSSFAASNLPTESIFLRLANRIKNLEINMSLSSTYLEEMSRRYRMQLELLSKSLNLTIQKVEEYSRVEEEKDRKREKELLLVRLQLANLTRDVAAFVTEQNSWRPQASSLSQHILFIGVEFLLLWVIFNYWRKPDEGFNEKSDATKKSNKKLKRRSSLEGVRGHEMPQRKTRRPSEEALDIALSRTYGRDSLKMEKKRKKRKKDSKCSLNGFHPRRKGSEVEALGGCFSENAAVAPVSEACIPKGGHRGSTATGEAISTFDKSSPSTSEAGHKASENVVAPAFMKTALAARNCRMREKESSSQEFNIVEYESMRRGIQKERKGSNSLKKYMKKFF